MSDDVWGFVCKWYDANEIERAIKRATSRIPSDVRSHEFAVWLADQYRLAMAKGIQIGREWGAMRDE